jgi:hypothetical protein
MIVALVRTFQFTARGYLNENILVISKRLYVNKQCGLEKSEVVFC